MLRVFLAISMVAYIALNIFTSIKHDLEVNFFIQMGCFSVLSVFYILIIIFLNLKMRKL